MPDCQIHKSAVNGIILSCISMVAFSCFIFSCQRTDKDESGAAHDIYKSMMPFDLSMREFPAFEDTMTVNPIIIRSRKTGNPDIIPYKGIQRAKAEIGWISEVDTDHLRVFTPGRDGLPSPRVYHFPEPSTKSYPEQIRSGEFTIQYGDTIIAPVMTRAIQPEALPALPMRMKDAANLDVRYLSTEQGLSDPDIRCILKDSRGNFWFGTVSAGLCCYDGSSLKYYSSREGLSDLVVRALLEDRMGNIWIGTAGGGLIKFDGKFFISHLIPGCSDVLSLLETDDGSIWFGTNGGMVKYNGRDWTLYGAKEGLTSLQILDIIEDQHGTIWAAANYSVYTFDGTSIKEYMAKEDMGSSYVNSITEDKAGNLWFTTGGGIRKYDGSLITLYLAPEGFHSESTSSIIEGNNGNLWFGSDGGGLNMYDGEYFIHYTTEQGFHNYINCLMEDEDHTIWMGTSGNGVMKFRENTFTFFTQFEQLGSGRISSVLEGRSGDICFGTQGRGLFTYDGDHLSRISREEGLSSDGILGMTEGRDGNLWVNYVWCVDRYNEDSVAQYWHHNEEDLSLYTIITGLCKDKNGEIWAGTQGEGIKRIDGDRFNPILKKISMDYWSGYVTSVLADRNGNIWYGTSDMGLFRYDGTTLTQFTGPCPINIISLFEDMKGQLWIGTQKNGLIKYDGFSFCCFTEEQGLSSNQVTSIMDDHSGRLWIGTQNGLSMLSPGAEGKYSIITFGADDGLRNINFNTNSVCLDSRNRIWWGTGDFATMMDLNAYQYNTDPPKVQLVDILLNQQHVDYGSLQSAGINNGMRKVRFTDVATFSNIPVDLVLPHHLNYLTFHFTAVYWTAPRGVRYQYMLKGMEDQWSELGTENKADYRNIRPGKYSFKIRAVGRAGIMSQTLEYPFQILRPWWSGWYAFTIYGIIMILLIRYYIRFILSRERIRSEMELKQVEVEKMEELHLMKSRFFANISHEFRTPLTLILGLVEGLLKRKEKELVLNHEEAGILHRNAKRLLQLINQILDISKLETGKVRLHVSEGDLNGFLKRIILSFLSLAESKNIEYNFDLQDHFGMVYFDRDKVEKIVTNLISNAFKYTPAGGKITIVVKYGPGNRNRSEIAEISVRDTGRGIPPDQVEKIFDRFYQVNSSDSRQYEGTGIGLSLAKELTVICRGEIRVESQPGKGSLFKVVLPVSREIFQEEEIVQDDQEPQDASHIFEDLTDIIPEGYVREESHSPEHGKEKPVILIVEDNSDLRQYISGNLHEEYHIVESENGREGLTIAIEEIPDLIITDLMMPEMDGIELCEKIRTDRATSHIPIVMLTARADKESKLKGLKTGADDYLIKPFDADELQARVRNLIRQRRVLKEKYQEEFVQTDPFTKEIPDLRDDFIAAVIKCILTHLGDPEYGVDQLARDVGFSRSQLYRKLLSMTGYVPNKFIRNIRLKQSARLFHEGHKNIAQVLYTVGFNSPSHFSRSFRDLYGMNPSDYLKQTFGSKG